MFAAVVAVVLCSGAQPDGCAGGCIPAAMAHGGYCHWLHSYPYSWAEYQQRGYDFRRAYDYPWSVRSCYSLPVWAAASTRRPWGREEIAAQEFLPTGPGATSSK